MARPSPARRLGAASLLTTLVLASASCGGDDDSTATDETASETSGDDSTEEPDASGDLEELSAEEFYPAVMTALQEAESMGFSVTTTGGAAATDMSGVMEYEDDGISMEASSTGARAMEMVMLDKVLYISGGGLPLPDGKKWFKVDMSDPNSLFGSLGKSTDPNLMFKAMETPKEFELLGTEEVDGVETNHYNVVMDTASYSDAPDLPAEVAKFLPEEIAIEMWVDADNQPRKFHRELEVPSMTGSGEPTLSTTEGTYYDFGTEVDVEAPPAAEVADNIPGLS
ncbi:hypothetical protein [Nocardioides sp. B-3]|uniref:hypothetical protein n=1 Tax=Nocardioides sp. B-3 TaxID=2895565 RepID=UPI00215356AE|nr:hypothetical protein [Nocardioides sp. B-3]UUZ60685.1 hypothetical protein LP418_07665 [Nocardioides sp. B-3]